MNVDLLLSQGSGRERHLARAGCSVDTGNVWVQPGGQHGGHDSPVARVPVGAWQSPPVVSWTPVRESQRVLTAVVHRAALSPGLLVEKPDVVELAAELRGHVFDSLQRFDAQEMFAAPLALEIAAVFVANLGAKNKRNGLVAGDEGGTLSSKRTLRQAAIALRVVRWSEASTENARRAASASSRCSSGATNGDL